MHCPLELQKIAHHPHLCTVPAALQLLAESLGWAHHHMHLPWALHMHADKYFKVLL